MSEQPKSDVQLCCEALAAAQQVWLESEQAQRLTGSGQPSEAEQLRQRVVELEQENERLCVLMACMWDDGACVGDIDHEAAYRWLGIPYPTDDNYGDEFDKLVVEAARHGRAVVKKGDKQ